ncbi:MAG: peptidoglycan DD-metalloendopeptidase family protein [Hyphomicrobiales bacterium]
MGHSIAFHAPGGETAPLINRTDNEQLRESGVRAHDNQNQDVSPSSSEIVSNGQFDIPSFELDHETAYTPLGLKQGDDAISYATGVGDSSHQEPAKKPWLITSCVAGVTFSLVIGAVLVGTFNGQSSSVSKLDGAWQTADSSSKSDLGSFANDDSLAKNGLILASTYSRDGGRGSSLNRAVAYGRGGLNAPLGADYPDLTGQPLSYDQDSGSALDRGYFTSNVINSQTSTTAEKNAPLTTFRKTVTMEHGDSLTGILIQNGISPGRTHRVLMALNPVFPVRHISRGQKIELTLAKQRAFHGGQETVPVKVSFRPQENVDREVVVNLSSNGRYFAEYGSKDEIRIAKPRIKPKVPAGFGGGRDHVLARAKINSSVYATANSAGIPKHVTASMLGVHSYDVDFQRQVRRGDSFEVFYGKPVDGKKTSRPVLLFSQLTLSGRKTKGYYRFTTPDDGITGYFDMNGRSMTTALMRTPVSGARISSGFGKRRHPILGYTKMHNGIDFAASYGTPVKAAGSGTVEVARRVGAYGKYIRIKHAKGYKTAYAHLSRYARGIKKGRKVRQGQVIGYVGSTGRSTGPHLHYEVLRGDRRIDPRKIRTASGRQLSGKILEKFKRTAARIDGLIVQAASNTKVAANR